MALLCSVLPVPCNRPVHVASRHDASAFRITQPDPDSMWTGPRVRRLKAEQVSVAIVAGESVHLRVKGTFVSKGLVLPAG